MIQILLIHNEFSIKEPITYLSKGIRIVTCSQWNHIAIRIGNKVIEAVGKGVIVTDYDEWFYRSNRTVLYMIPKEDVQLHLRDVLLTEGEQYGFLDLVEAFNRIRAERWNKKEYIGKDRKGLICSDIACILLRLPKIYIPSDFEYRFPHLLNRGSEYKTYKR